MPRGSLASPTSIPRKDTSSLYDCQILRHSSHALSNISTDSEYWNRESMDLYPITKTASLL